MARRKRKGSPFSLFSFQDIITCVSGIIILITLILAVELAQRSQGSPVASAAEVSTDIREAIAATETAIRELEQELQKRASATEEAAAAHEEILQADVSAVNQQIKSLQAELAELRRKQKRAAEESEKVQAKLFDQQKETGDLGEAEEEVKNLEDKLKTLVSSDRPIYNARSSDGKQVWLIQIEGQFALVARAGTPSKPESLPHGGSLISDSAFAKWLDGHSRSADFLFFLIRPAGIEAFGELQEEAKKRRFSYGFDLIGESQAAVDPETGAAGL